MRFIRSRRRIAHCGKCECDPPINGTGGRCVSSLFMKEIAMRVVTGKSQSPVEKPGECPPILDASPPAITSPPRVNPPPHLVFHKVPGTPQQALEQRQNLFGE